MNNLRVALLQIKPEKSLQENLIKGLKACEEAKKMEADIALFPEMWSNGYDIYTSDASNWQKDAITLDSEYIESFKKKAKELSIAIGVTFLEKVTNGVRNSLALIDRFGTLKYVYAKVHTCAFDVEKALTPGDDFYVTELDTAKGIVKVGSMICFDREFPESARILMLKGAELILVPNACPMEINRLAQLRARAYENMLAIATCNYPDLVPDCNGISTVFDGVAYLEEEPYSRDTCILQAPSKEGIYLANLDLDLLRKYREKEVHGNAYRHPEKYSELINKTVNYPFIRKK